MNWIPLTAVLSLVATQACMTSRREEQLQTSLRQLEGQVAEIKKTLIENPATSGGEDTRKIALALKQDVEELRKEISALQGTLDEHRMKLTKLQESAGQTPDLSSHPHLQDVSKRLAALEDKILKMPEPTPESAAPQKSNAPKKEAAPKKANPPKFKSEKELTKNLETAFHKREYGKIIELSSDVLDSNLAKPMKEVALGFRGEAHFAQGNYDKSAEDLQNFVKLYPKSDRAPRAILLAGDSLVLLKRPKNAKEFYSECVKKHPKREECKAAKERLERLSGD